MVDIRSKLTSVHVCVCVCVRVHIHVFTSQGFQRQLADQSDLPLVETLTQEIQELRERLAQQDPSPPLHRDRQHNNDNNNRQPEFGGGHQRSMGQYL